MNDRSYRSRPTVRRRFLLAAFAFLCLSPRFTANLYAQDAPKPHRKVVFSVQPDYPAFLRTGHFEGQVHLQATVQPNGNVSKVDVKGGNPILCEYASKAVMKWKYAPASAQTVEEVVFYFNSNSQ